MVEDFFLWVLGFIVGWFAYYFVQENSYAILSQQTRDIINCATALMDVERPKHPNLSQQDLTYLCMDICSEKGPPSKWRTVAAGLLLGKGKYGKKGRATVN